MHPVTDQLLIERLLYATHWPQPLQVLISIHMRKIIKTTMNFLYKVSGNCYSEEVGGAENKVIEHRRWLAVAASVSLPRVWG